MIEINGTNLQLIDYINVVRNREPIILSPYTIKKIISARRTIDGIISQEKIVYGINTGFGNLSNVAIDSKNLKLLQKNLILSHSCGVGTSFSEEVIRGIMLLRINTLAQGYSGVSLEVINQLITYINNGIHPVIPEKGSLGASGDLVPLSHMALALIGKGEVFYNGRKLKTSDALKIAKIPPLKSLSAKDGLCLINGTQAMTALGAIVLYESINIVKLADICCSLSIEALLGIRESLDIGFYNVRPHKGIGKTCKNIQKLLYNSKLTSLKGQHKVQDPYSLRCAPQVHGTTKDALNYVLEKTKIEMNSVTDNPIIYEGKIISGGNFHGQPLANAFDFLKIAISELANISERRIERMVNPYLSEGLPPFLSSKPGINSGFMIVQYSAASLVSENKVLSHPASVDSIPSSANQEDHVSMGTIAVRNARDILENVKYVLAMELFTACQAIDYRKSSDLGKGTLIAYNTIRKYVPFLENDSVMSIHINKIKELIDSNELLECVEKAIKPLEF